MKVKSKKLPERGLFGKSNMKKADGARLKGRKHDVCAIPALMAHTDADLDGTHGGKGSNCHGLERDDYDRLSRDFHEEA